MSVPTRHHQKIMTPRRQDAEDVLRRAELRRQRQQSIERRLKVKEAEAARKAEERRHAAARETMQRLRPGKIAP